MKRAPWIALAAVLVFWILTRPVTVQDLDSGELVTAAFRWTVAHPPGFPLLVSLQAAFLRLWPWGNAFSKAALLNLGFATAALAALATLGRARSGAAAAVLLVLASAAPFWRNALIPDAFALNAALAACVLACAALAETRPRARSAAVLASALGLANHPTLIFLAPLLVPVFQAETRAGMKTRFAAILVGLPAAVSLLLFTMHPSHPASWGELHDLSGWLRHLTRAEYGLFQLSPHSQGPRVPAAQAAAWGSLLLAQLAPVTVLALLGLRRLRADRWARLTWLCLLAYLVLFVLPSNLPPWGATQDMMQRFLVLPLVLLAALALRALGTLRSRQLGWIWTAALLVQAAVNFQQFRHEYDFSNRFDIEDWARNFLKGVRPGHPTWVLAEDDTRFFALRYAHEVLGDAPSAWIVSQGRSFDAHELDKLSRQISGLTWNAEAVRNGDRDIVRQLVLPNLTRLDFMVTGAPEPTGVRTVQLPLGRRLEAGTGLLLERPYEPVFHAKTSQNPLDGRYRFEQALRAELTHYWLELGKREVAAHRTDSAREAFRQALREFDGCWPAALNLCRLSTQQGDPLTQENRNCVERAKALRKRTESYF